MARCRSEHFALQKAKELCPGVIGCFRAIERGRMEILERVAGAVIGMELVANAEPRQLRIEPRDIRLRRVAIVLAEYAENGTMDVRGERKGCRYALAAALENIAVIEQHCRHEDGVVDQPQIGAAPSEAMTDRADAIRTHRRQALQMRHCDGDVGDDLAI